MTGHVRKRGNRWEVFLELGEQAAQRCPACVRVDARGRERGRLYWTDKGRLDACPQCGGELDDLTARRQEVLAARHTTKTAALKALHDELRDRERGDYVAPVDLTVRAYLEDRWLPSLAAEELSPATIGVYEAHVRRVLPSLGSIPLQKLTRNDVSLLAARMATETSETTGRPLSPATRSGALVTLQRALSDAVRAGMLRSNPATGVKRPRVRRPDMHTWSGAELAKFLKETRDDRMGPLWHVLALTGMRRGEALGLQWSDVDLDSGRLHVQRQRALATGYEVTERPTKGGKPRAVSLDAGTVEALRRQSQQQLDDAQAWGDAWRATGHVFTREDGGPWHPDRVRVLFREALARVDVPRIRMHDLRHTWATLALRAGVHPKVVQERLGHANIRITLDTYSHVLPDMQESAAELVAALVDLSDGSAEPS